MFLVLVKNAKAYHVLTTADDPPDATAYWDEAEFIVDQTLEDDVDYPDPLEAHAPANATDNGVPNDDGVGLLYVVDNNASGVDCDGGVADDPYANVGMEPYNSIYNALATWSSQLDTTINLQYVCSAGDITADDIDGPGLIFNGTTPVLNGFNEIIIDDTDTGDIFDAFIPLIGGLDLSSVLGIGVPIDPNRDGMGSGNGNNPITEAFLILNETTGGPMDDLIREGVVLHEVGHTLGFAHTNAILNARSLTQYGANNNPSLLPPGFDDFDVVANIPTMHYAVPGGIDDLASLEIDDLGAAIRTYCGICGGAAPLGAGYGAISGYVHDETDDAIVGAAVIAYKTDMSGDEIGVFIGGNPNLDGSGPGGLINDNGDYRIDWVPAGEYYVTVIPLRRNDESSDLSPGANVDGIFPTLTANFDEVFYLIDDDTGAASEATSDTVMVVDAMEVVDVNFSINTTSGPVGGTGPVVHGPALDGACQAVSMPFRGLNALANLIPWLIPFALWGWNRRRKFSK